MQYQGYKYSNGLSQLTLLSTYACMYIIAMHTHEYTYNALCAYYAFKHSYTNRFTVHIYMDDKETYL